ncbi:hypothetical protein EVAR_33564_1 [Eumeta japonica]|uniref:Uncharacterized protein n=1 Tax=Eumeta variegata TaxID=151549 RepID=A0A4C1VJQ4_EUMVA|nr:hypothetical protein EVAR_33564_1 [Eumeta japonica]
MSCQAAWVCRNFTDQKTSAKLDVGFRFQRRGYRQPYRTQQIDTEMASARESPMGAVWFPSARGADAGRHLWATPERVERPGDKPFEIYLDLPELKLMRQLVNDPLEARYHMSYAIATIQILLRVEGDFLSNFPLDPVYVLWVVWGGRVGVLFLDAVSCINRGDLVHEGALLIVANFLYAYSHFTLEVALTGPLRWGWVCACATQGCVFGSQQHEACSGWLPDCWMVVEEARGDRLVPFADSGAASEGYFLLHALVSALGRPSYWELDGADTEYIPATFHDVNTAVYNTSKTKEVRPRDLCKDAPRCPDKPNKEAFNDARWMTGHVGHPRPPSASHAPQTPMFQTKEP